MSAPVTDAAPIWAAMIGQAPAVRMLSRAASAAAQSVADADSTHHPVGMTHAWLFVGPAGSGRSVAARAFAAALQCERPASDGDPGCGVCPGCRTTQART